MIIQQPSIKKHAGFSTLELVISEAIALMLISALLVFVAPTVVAIGHVKSNSDLQDSSRLAFDHLQKAVFQAGYPGCRTTQSHTSIIDASSNSISPGLRHWAYQSFGIRGFDADEEERIANTLGAYWRNRQYQYGNQKIGDLIAVQHPIGPVLTLQQHNPAQSTLIFKGQLNGIIQPGHIIHLNDCHHSARVQINPHTSALYSPSDDTTTVSYASSNSINCNLDPTILISLGPDDTEGCGGTGSLDPHELFEFDSGSRGHIVNSETYYVGYDATAEAPALKRSGFATNAARIYTETLVEGVENLRIRYGVDTDDDGLPNRFMRAADITLHDTVSDSVGWASVVNLKMWILLRSSKKSETNSSLASSVFPTTSGENIDCQAAETANQEEYQDTILACPFSDDNLKQYERKVITHVVNLSNKNT